MIIAVGEKGEPMSLIDGDALLKRVQQEKIQAQVHGREFSTCFMSPGGTPSTEWWFVEDLIENAPTIEPKRKKGKWIMKYKGSAVTSYKCSECGRTVKEDTGYDVSKDYPFCHCGADMREKQNESKAEVNGCIPGDCGESS